MKQLAKGLGRRVYQLRKGAGFTQAALADKSGISNEFMSAIERGAKLPSIGSLQRIADALAVSIQDLFGVGFATREAVWDIDREVLDLAHKLSRLPVAQRRKILRVIRTLMK